MVRKRITVKGKVQGVGYRFFVYRKALALGIKGWVRNLDNGDVEAVFEGPELDVNKILEECQEGPGSAIVKDIDVIEDASHEDYQRFSIR